MMMMMILLLLLLKMMMTDDDDILIEDEMGMSCEADWVWWANISANSIPLRTLSNTRDLDVVTKLRWTTTSTKPTSR